MESCCMHTMKSIVYALNNAMHGMTTVVDHFVEWGNTFLDFCSIFYSRYEDRECRIKIVQLPLLCAYASYSIAIVVNVGSSSSRNTAIVRHTPPASHNPKRHGEHRTWNCMLHAKHTTIHASSKPRNANERKRWAGVFSLALCSPKRIQQTCCLLPNNKPHMSIFRIWLCCVLSTSSSMLSFSGFQFLFARIYIYICDVARYTMHNARSICAYWHTHTQCEWEPFIDWILCRWYANCKSPNTNNRGMALWFERTKTWSRKREREHWPFRYSLLCFATPVLVQACIQFFAKMPHPPRP